MDFIKNIKNISKFANIRKEQLEIQKNIDEKLYKVTKICPDKVSKYLLIQRELSRKHQYKILESNISEYFNILEIQLQENYKIYEDIQNALNHENPCYKLSILISSE